MTVMVGGGSGSCSGCNCGGCASACWREARGVDVDEVHRREARGVDWDAALSLGGDGVRERGGGKDILF